MPSDVPVKPKEDEGHRRLRNSLIGTMDRAGYDVQQAPSENMLDPDAVATPSPCVAPEDVFVGEAPVPDVLNYDGEIVLVAVSTDQILFETPIIRIFKNAVNTGKKCVFAVKPLGEYEVGGEGVRPPGADEPPERGAGDVCALFGGEWIEKSQMLTQTGREAPSDGEMSSWKDERMEHKVGVKQYIHDALYSLYPTFDRLVLDRGEAVPLRPRYATGQWFRNEFGGVICTLVDDGLGDIEGCSLSDLEGPYEDISIGDSLVRYDNIRSYIRNDPDYVYAKRTRYSVGDRHYTLHMGDSAATIEDIAWKPSKDDPWRTINRPFVPDVEFNRPPQREDWCLLEADSDAPEQFHLIE